MKHLFLLLFLLSGVQPSEYEDYFGKYQSTNKQNQIAFEFDKMNITGLVIDGVPINDDRVTYNILGIFDGSMLFHIHFVDSNKRECVITTLIHVERHKFVVGSGFFMVYRLDENYKPKTLQTYTFELKRR
ncbi:MAG: hypothetical protein HGB11_13515 [Chlorobiales bacterium]|nr:hypothetical protein [Chlorobiales bacterium]